MPAFEPRYTPTLASENTTTVEAEYAISRRVDAASGGDGRSQRRLSRGPSQTQKTTKAGTATRT